MYKKHLLFFQSIFTLLLLILSIPYVHARFLDQSSNLFQPKPFIFFLLPCMLVSLFFWLIQKRDFYEDSIYHTIQPYLSLSLILTLAYLFISPLYGLLFSFPLWLIHLKIDSFVKGIAHTKLLFRFFFSIYSSVFFVLSLIHATLLISQFIKPYEGLIIGILMVMSILYITIQSMLTKDYLTSLPFVFYYSSFALHPTITEPLKIICTFGLGISLFILYSLLKQRAKIKDESISFI